jgi:hypothetical protein
MELPPMLLFFQRGDLMLDRLEPLLGLRPVVGLFIVPQEGFEWMSGR